jgi:hypothetical protein
MRPERTMASEFPRSPRNLKGALVVFEAAVPVPTNIIVFQYNPETVRRRIGASSRTAEENAPAGGGGGQEMQPPREMLTLEVELDATDRLEFPGQHPLTATTGLHAPLAALELLLYPPSTGIILNRVLSAAGSSIMRSATAPLVLLVWGITRVLPVTVASVQIHEQAFDTMLNPIRANVSLGLKALTYAELQQIGGPLGALGLVNQIAKELLARANGVSAALEVTAGISF